MNANIFLQQWFIIYLVGLTIAPALFSAAIYLSLSRIIAIYGSGLTLFTPRTTTITFICCDLLSLILQAAGGAIASTSQYGTAEAETGVNIMIAGLSTQVAATTAFCGLCLHLAWNIRKKPERLNQDSREFREGRKFKLFLAGKISLMSRS
jgi:hypothetical protein